MQGPLTGVVDLGKTRSRLVLVDPQGRAVEQREQRSASQATAGGWRALDVAGTQAWLAEALASLGAQRAALGRLIVTTHGAAVAALAGDALALPVPDYEDAAFDERPAATLAAIAEQAPFDDTASPLLPRGLNLGLQLDWLARHEAPALARADTLLPYPQYWAWWLSGQRASEVSSLGCHTLLWQPRRQAFSRWAEDRGWAARFAPLRSAWEVLGTVRPALAQCLGLPEGLQVHVGVHDSNACLARWLRHWPRLTLVSTGTWVVVMAPGAARRTLDPAADELANVSVRGEAVPTARFMGGRELQALCAGADPALASLDTLAALLARGLQVLPGFEPQGGAFRHCIGTLHDARGPLALTDLTPAERATAAAWYVALMTAHTIERLGGAQPVVLEGPFAHNPVIVAALAALLPPGALHAVGDGLEGTVAGSAMLARWTEQRPALDAPPAAEPGPGADALRAAQARWQAAVAALGAVLAAPG